MPQRARRPRYENSSSLYFAILSRASCLGSAGNGKRPFCGFFENPRPAASAPNQRAAEERTIRAPQRYPHLTSAVPARMQTPGGGADIAFYACVPASA